MKSILYCKGKDYVSINDKNEENIQYKNHLNSQRNPAKIIFSDYKMASGSRA